VVTLKRFAKPAAIVALCWSLFQLYAAFYSFHPLVAIPIHVGFALALTFLLFPLVREKQAKTENPDEPPAKAVLRWWDYLFALLSIAIPVYVLIHEARIVSRIPGVDLVTGLDMTFAILTIVLILEASRRTMGWGMTGIVLFFLAYQFLGKIMTGLSQYLPVGVLAHRGDFTFLFLKDMLDQQFLQSQGMFGTPSQVSYDTVFYFILFGAFLELSGGGKLFLDLAFRMVGRFRGGAAKAAIVSSSLFGSISGSAVANVAVTGTFTIPMMKKAGFRGSDAAAVEAVASTGGQIMPPVMGAAAFLMAQFLGVPYADVMIAAIIPALIFYAALYFIVDLTAARDGIRGLEEHEIGVTWGSIARQVHLLIPVVTVIWLVMQNLSLMRVGLLTVSVIAGLMLVMRIITLLGTKGNVLEHLSGYVVDLLAGLESAAKQAVQVAIPCAAAGIVVGIVVMTGLGVKFTSIVVSVGGGYLLPSMFLLMIAVIVLGMGMPTTSAYLVGMIVAVPVLTELKVDPTAAHMFVLYFASLSMVTPPIALAAFVAAGIAGVGIWEAGWKAFRNSLPGFIIAYAFVFNPALLMKGSLVEIIWTTASATLGTYALSAAFAGYMLRRNRIWESIVLFVSGFLLIVPEKSTDTVGLVCVVSLLVLQGLTRTA
jgi:TRAP transporter 4TM/12TM fusion protein